MANHKSAQKRIRQSAKRRVANRYYKKSARTTIQKFREILEKGDAEQLLPKVVSMIDKLAKKNTWHPNKAANLKSSLMKQLNSLS
ncbi:MAG: 30S ribosomal protein S20 [Haliscomenobacter sp.]